jgi:hypothetical protein
VRGVPVLIQPTVYHRSHRKRDSAGRPVLPSRIITALVFVLAVCLHPDIVRAQEPPTKLIELSLEELMALDIISINVLGTHTHLQGQLMVSYELRYMSMKGERVGTRSVGNEAVLARYATSPTEMTVAMHMPMIMYAPSNDVTLMAMLPYTRNWMNHVDRAGMPFIEESSGIGDLNLNVLYTFYKTPAFGRRLVLNAGLNLPTGSITRTMDGLPLEYPMQLGSGSVEALPGLTYLAQSRNWAGGAEVVPRFRLNENSRHYRLGNQLRLTSWVARRWTDWLSVSTRIDGQVSTSIHQADPALDPEDEPTKDPSIQGGKRLDLSIGLNLYAPRGALKGHRLAIEGSWPMYESFDGPQLETSWQVHVGWQWILDTRKRKS